MILYFIIAVSVIFIYLFIKDRSRSNLPPGKLGLPIIGAFPKLDVPFLEQIEENRRKFGDTFIWRVGSREVVFVCDPKTIRKAFNNPHLINRPQEYFTFDANTNFKKIGLVNSNGIQWQTHRRFAYHHLRESGYSKTSTVDGIIQLEAEALVADVRKNHLNKPVSIPKSVHLATLNVIAKLSTGTRFELEDEKTNQVLAALSSFIHNSQGIKILFDIFPWMVRILPLSLWRFIISYKAELDQSAIQSFIMSMINEKKATLDLEHPNGMIEDYLAQMAKCETEGLYSEEALLATIADLFVAGNDTTAISTDWILQYITCHPEIQKKIQEEIDAAIPRDRYPSLSDKPRLPYTEATVHDVLRLSSLGPVGLFHEASEDTTIDQYFIPKGTIIAPYFRGCHISSDYWEKPLELYPEHFLDSDGKFTAKNEAFLPFSSGRRVCMGESLARSELFLYTAALLQNFTFSIPEGGRDFVEVSPDSKVFLFPSDLKVLIKER